MLPDPDPSRVYETTRIANGVLATQATRFTGPRGRVTGLGAVMR